MTKTVDLPPDNRRSFIKRAGLTTAVETFQQARAALQRDSASLATSRAGETPGPATREQECRATRLIGKRTLKLGKRAPPRHALFIPSSPRVRALR